MKRILIVTNLLTLLLLGFIGYKLKQRKHNIPQRKCEYKLSDFDFHYKQQCDSPHIIFIGDSRTGMGNWDILLNRKDIINRGINGDKMYCVCERINYLKNSTAKICFIEGGVVDLYTEQEDSIINSFKIAIQFCKENNKIPVLNLIVYVSPKASMAYEAGNKKITLINQKLQRYARENNIDCIDLNKKFTDAKDNILKETYSSDGVHFNQAAYIIWAEEVQLILHKYKI